MSSLSTGTISYIPLLLSSPKTVVGIWEKLNELLKVKHNLCEKIQVNSAMKQLIAFCGPGSRKDKNEYEWTHQNHK